MNEALYANDCDSKDGGEQMAVRYYSPQLVFSVCCIRINVQTRGDKANKYYIFKGK